jgi:hypothetical protein
MIKSNNDQEINIIINLVVKTFSNELLKIVTKLPLTHRFKDLHIKLFELSGLTGLSLQTVNTIAEKLSLEYELTKPLKMTTTINIHQLFYNILIRDNKACSTISFDCLFTDEYINKLSLTIINIWELILDTIIKTIKYDKIILFYAFSIDFVDQLNQIKKLTPIENFSGLEIGTSDTTSARKRADDLQEIDKKIDKSKVIAGMAKLMSNAVATTVSKNNADLMKLIKISNEINLENISTGGDFIISGTKQTTNIEQDVKMVSAQTITNKIVNDITKNLLENINMAAEETNINKKSLTDTGKGGTSVGGIVDSIANVAGKGVDALKDILSLSIGTSTSNISSDEATKKLKDMFNLNESFRYEKNNETADTISNLLTSDNLSKCDAKTTAENKLSIKGAKVGGTLRVEGTEQVGKVSDVMECVFTQTIYNDIASKLVSDYNLTIKNLVKNINDNVDEVTKARIEGDIYAMGAAGSAILESVGNAGSKIIEEGGTAGQKILKGAAEVVKEGGDAIGNVVKGTALYIALAIFGCLVAFGSLIYIMRKADDSEKSQVLSTPNDTITPTDNLSSVALPVNNTGEFSETSLEYPSINSLNVSQ